MAHHPPDEQSVGPPLTGILKFFSQLVRATEDLILLLGHSSPCPRGTRILFTAHSERPDFTNHFMVEKRKEHWKAHFFLSPDSSFFQNNIMKSRTVASKVHQSIVTFMEGDG